MTPSSWAQTAIEFKVSAVFLAFVHRYVSLAQVRALAFVTPQLTTALLDWLQSGAVFAHSQRRQKVRVRVSCRQAARRDRRLERKFQMAAVLSLPRSSKPKRCSRVSGLTRPPAASNVAQYPAAKTKQQWIKNGQSSRRSQHGNWREPTARRRLFWKHKGSKRKSTLQH